MKIDLIKNHTLGNKGETITVSQPRGDYLIRMGVAIKHVAKAKKNDKPRTTRKSKAKPKS